VHPPPSPARANFTLMTESTPESSGYYSVYSVFYTNIPQSSQVRHTENHILIISRSFHEELLLGWSRNMVFAISRNTTLNEISTFAIFREIIWLKFREVTRKIARNYEIKISRKFRYHPSLVAFALLSNTRKGRSLFVCALFI
jgi:hypothetical protein